MSFVDRSYRVQGAEVVCDTAVSRADLDALVDALAARRHVLSIAGLDNAEAVLEVRRITALQDRLDAARGLADPAPMTMSADEVRLLAGAAGAYVAERDGDDYLPSRMRERLQRLSTASGTLMDCGAELAAAHAEAVEKRLIQAP